MLPFPLVFWDFAFASLIRPFDDFDSCSRVWPRMPVVPMFAFSVFISGRTAPIGNDTTDSCSRDCVCDFIFSVFFLSFSSPVLASILHFEIDLVRSFLFRFVL